LAWIYYRRDPAEAAQARELLSRVAAETALVPGLWHVEVLNGLVTGQRRGFITMAVAADFLERLDRLAIATDEVPPSHRRAEIFALAREYRLSAYDATYLELALRTGSALASFDKRLTRAQEIAGVPGL
jgi:predicted nucleic acid-binding protein